MKKVLICIAIATSMFASVDIIGLNIYKNGNFVKQKLDLKEKSVELLSNISIEDIKFEVANECKVNSFDLINKDFQSDELSKMIIELEEKIALKENRIKALNSSNSFLEKSSLSSISNTKTLEESATFVKEEILKNYNEIYTIEGFIKEEKRELDELNNKRTSKKRTLLSYDIRCKNADVFISYPIFDLEKNGLFDINYDSKNKKLELKNTFFITQSTGFDLKDIEINIYTYNFNNQIKPIKFYPEYLDLNQPIAMAKAEMAMDVAPRVLKMQAPISQYLENSSNSFFNVTHVNLISGKKSEIILSDNKFDATASVEIDGFSSAQAFYKVDFKSDKLFTTQGSKLFLDGVYIGKATFDEIKKINKVQYILLRTDLLT